MQFQVQSSRKFDYCQSQSRRSQKFQKRFEGAVHVPQPYKFAHNHQMYIAIGCQKLLHGVVDVQLLWYLSIRCLGTSQRKLPSTYLLTTQTKHKQYYMSTPKKWTSTAGTHNVRAQNKGRPG